MIFQAAAASGPRAREVSTHVPAVAIGKPEFVKADWPFHENDREIWPPEGLIVIGTDGLWETLNAAGEAFGKEGLMAVLRATSALTAAEICAQVIERVRAFAGNVPQADDMTVVVIKFTPP